MMKFQIEILSDYIETNGLEVDEHRLPKVEKMKRFIELADNHIKDDFADRCGYDYDYNMNWITLEDDDNNLSELKTTETNTQKTNNSKAIKASHKLDEKEWKEMIELLKDMRSWWD